MGFSLALMIYSRVERDDIAPEVKLWYHDEVLNCGRINRQVQGVIEEGGKLPESYNVYHAHDIAGTALTSLLFKRFPTYARDQGQSIFAPPFLLEGTYGSVSEVSEFYERDSFDAQAQWLKNLTTGAERLVPKGFGGLWYDVWPNLIQQSRHNENDRSGATTVNGFIGSRPSCWIPCSELASWLKSFWQLESTSRLVLEKNARARARLEGWQAQLESYGTIGSRVLFVFEDYRERHF